MLLYIFMVFSFASEADFEGGSNSDGKCVPVESDRAMHSSDVEKRSSTLLAAGCVCRLACSVLRMRDALAHS